MAPPLGVPPNKVTGDLALDSPHPHIGTYDTPSEGPGRCCCCCWCCNTKNMENIICIITMPSDNTKYIPINNNTLRRLNEV